MMVSAAGEAAVSGISLVDSMTVLFIQLFSALATGGAVIVSQYLGKGDKENSILSAKQLIYSSTSVAMMMTFILLIFSRQSIRLIFGSIGSDVMSNAVVYFRITLLSYPALAIFNSCTALFRSMNNSRISLFCSVVINLINVFGNAIFIFGFGLGSAGTAISTLIARCVGAIMVLAILCKKSHPLYLEGLHKIYFDFTRNMHFFTKKRALIRVP